MKLNYIKTPSLEHFSRYFILFPTFKDLSNDIGLTDELIKILIDPESSSE